jgi:HSP20 family protein
MTQHRGNVFSKRLSGTKVQERRSIMAVTETKPEVRQNTEPTTRPWDPFTQFETLQDEMQRIWGQTWPLVPRPLSGALRRLSLAPSAWVPTMDVFEQDGWLVVKAELPGVKKEDIEVKLEYGDLVIRGERREVREVKEEEYYRLERSRGSFYRRIPLPFDVQSEQVTADYTNGLLEVRVPRPAQEQPAPKKIEIK